MPSSVYLKRVALGALFLTWLAVTKFNFVCRTGEGSYFFSSKNLKLSLEIPLPHFPGFELTNPPSVILPEQEHLMEQQEQLMKDLENINSEWENDFERATERI